MTEKFGLNDASRIIDVIDNRISKNIRSGAKVEMTWGEVVSVSADNKTASAYLYGETDSAYASDGFRIPDTMYLTIGDKVKVAMDYSTGERWIEEVNVPTAYKKIAVSPTTGAILTGDGTVPPVAFSGVPTGAITMYGAAAAPSGWLLCDGTAVSRSTYADLFAIIGTTFGVGDGSTTFNLPNMKSRFPVGRDAANARWDVLAETGGAETHTHAAHSNLTHTNNHAGGAVSAHTGGAVSAHTLSTNVALSAHTGTAVAAHSNHSHELPFTIDDTTAISSINVTTFGSGTSRTRRWTTSTSSASGSYAVADSQAVGLSAHSVTDPAAHTITQPVVAAHTFTQPSAHTFTQPSAHADHTISGHDSPASVPPYIALNFIIKA